ncbi:MULTISPECIES: zinc ribbon domain-containing protein [unclassified Acidovorax]|uniref:zinc ribbon domain-containing protein n=1 Tax=unclassified Acidovorax TaxID=2684926 RepID=UPI00288320F8|nr:MULTISPECIES: zinc ribbon domain-containing protein [unclassified Acidovorax]
MALIRCPECSREVSSHAPACPGCGYPLKAGVSNEKQPAWESPSVWGRIAAMFGAWMIAPWIARLVFGLGALVLGYFMFTKK